MKTEKQIHTGRPAAVSRANDANKQREVPKKNTHFYHLTVFKVDGYTCFKASSQKHLGQQIVTTCKIKSLKSTVESLLWTESCCLNSFVHNPVLKTCWSIYGCWTGRGMGLQKVSSRLLEWEENNFNSPAKVAGRWNKLVKLKTVSTSFKSAAQKWGTGLLTLATKLTGLLTDRRQSVGSDY